MQGNMVEWKGQVNLARTGSLKNPMSEIRNPKEIRRPKFEGGETLFRPRIDPNKRQFESLLRA